MCSIQWTARNSIKYNVLLTYLKYGIKVLVCILHYRSVRSCICAKGGKAVRNDSCQVVIWTDKQTIIPQI